MEESAWFIIHAKQDDSFCLVPSIDVICEPTVKVGDEVQFVYRGYSKKPLHGIVKDMGDDHDAMSARLDEWNKSRSKLNGSFHADKPRRAKVVCQSELKGLLKCEKRGKNDKNTLKTKVKENNLLSEMPDCIKPKDCRDKPKSLYTNEESKINKQKADAVLSKVAAHAIYSDSSDTDSTTLPDNMDLTNEKQSSEVESTEVVVTDENDTASEDELTPEQLAQIFKMAKKNRASDVKSLIDLAQKVKDANASQKGSLLSQAQVTNQSEISAKLSFLSEASGSNFSNGPAQSDLTAHENTKQSVTGTKRGKDNADDESSLSETDSKEVSTRPKKNKRIRFQKKTFTGEYFRFKKDDPDVVELWSHTSVYISEAKLKAVRRQCMTSTALARHLTKAIFSDQALAECSVKGRPSSARNGQQREIRPPLHPDGVTAIIEFCKHRAEKKKWREPLESAITKAMGDIICEDRYFEKLAKQDAGINL